VFEYLLDLLSPGSKSNWTMVTLHPELVQQQHLASLMFVAFEPPHLECKWATWWRNKELLKFKFYSVGRQLPS